MEVGCSADTPPGRGQRCVGFLSGVRDSARRFVARKWEAPRSRAHPPASGTRPPPATPAPPGELPAICDAGAPRACGPCAGRCVTRRPWPTRSGHRTCPAARRVRAGKAGDCEPPHPRPVWRISLSLKPLVSLLISAPARGQFTSAASSLCVTAAALLQETGTLAAHTLDDPKTAVQIKMLFRCHLTAFLL
jgi:hypothetical protein